jgi:hypothetical protein
MPSLRLQPPLASAPPSPTSSYADDGAGWTLADITDFNLRQKTAELMVVAPGLPVADIYHPLMERRGRLEEAKQDVIRQNQRMFTTSSMRKPLPGARVATVSATITNEVEEKDEDDTYIKIDFDDPSFLYDNDAPMEPSAEASRQRRNGQVRPKKSARKSAAKPTKSATNAPHSFGHGSTRPRSPSYTSPRSPGTSTKSNLKTTYPTTPTRADESRKSHVIKSSKGKSVGDMNRVCGRPAMI